MCTNQRFIRLTVPLKGGCQSQHTGAKGDSKLLCSKNIYRREKEEEYSAGAKPPWRTLFINKNQKQCQCQAHWTESQLCSVSFKASCCSFIMLEQQTSMSELKKYMS